MDLHCNICLTGRTGDVIGAQCKTQNCPGLIEEQAHWHDLITPLPEKMTCGRHYTTEADGDYWEQFKSNGNRVCSYCGSLHPDDFLALVKTCAEDDDELSKGILIEPSDKSYKIYVTQPGVRNAREGGIKFYTHHLPRKENGEFDLTQVQCLEYAAAARKTRIKFLKHLSEDIQ